MNVPDRCPACGGPRGRLPKPVQGHEIFRCQRCGLQWWDFSSVDVTEIYDDAYFEGASDQGYDDYYALRSAVEKTTRHRLGRIDQVLGHRSGRLLDVGCGPGFSVRAAVDAGWTATGLEISEAASRYGRDVLEVDVRTGPVDAPIDFGTPFDVVTLWDVIEHLATPGEAIDAVQSKLRPGGALVMTTGNVNSTVARLSGERWHLYTFPEHLYFHTPESLTHLLERRGFVVRAIEHAPMFTSVRYIYERLSKTLLGGLGRGWASRVPEVMLPVNLWDIMTVYAVAKPAAVG